eukprot:Pgem_evm1s10819
MELHFGVVDYIFKNDFKKMYIKEEKYHVYEELNSKQVKIKKAASYYILTLTACVNPFTIYTDHKPLLGNWN